MTSTQNHTLDHVFYALSHPVRRTILDAICQETADISTLAKPHAMSIAAISKHIAILEKAGLLTKKRHGNRIMCNANLWSINGATDYIAFLKKYL